MGLPLTWVTLNILHLFWVEQSLTNLGKLPYTSKKVTRICGDDLIGFWTPSHIREYERLIVESGGQLS